MTIAQARAAARNARVRVQGTVTLPTGVVDGGTAVIQDSSGAIVVRLSGEAGSVRLGQRIDVSGTRSTKSGMETIRVTVPPRSLAAGPEPTPRTLATGAAAEAVEAQLVVVRGGLVASARRASSGTVSMDIDDGSGPLRVVVGSALALDRSALVEGAWVEVRGVLGQETTGAQPARGYRVWPRSAGDVRVTAGATDAAGGSPGEGGAEGANGSGGGEGALDDLGAIDASTAGAGPVGATLVTGRWTELGLGGLLWDGERLVGLPSSDADRIAATLGGRPPPLALELTGMRSAPGQRGSPVPMASVGAQPDAVRPSDSAPVAPATVRPGPGEPARWFAAVGRLDGPSSEPRLRTSTGIVPLDRRCESDDRPPRGLVTVTGIALPDSDALLVPCDGIMAGSTLVRPASNDRLSGATEGETASDESVPSGSASPAGMVAAAMLGAAALVLVGAAAWLRWRPDEPDPDASDATDGPPAGRSAGDASAPPPAPPVLTLVTLPHERSPERERAAYTPARSEPAAAQRSRSRS
jgi:hypothetical protein